MSTHNELRRGLKKSLLETGLINNRKFLKRVFDKGNLYTRDGHKVTNWENFIILCELMDMSYKDNWSISVSDSRSSIISIFFVIRYPEITITNRNGYTHIVNDFLVFFTPIVCDNIVWISHNKIHGHKMTFTHKEYQQRYIHSHLPRFHPNSEYGLGLPFSDSTFCLGDSELAEMMSIMRVEDFDPMYFSLFLETLDSYLEYESLEGGPYSYMSEIESADVYETPSSIFKRRPWEKDPSFTSYTYEKNLKNKIEILNLDINFLNKSFQIVNNEKFKKEVYKVFENPSNTAYLMYDTYVLISGERKQFVESSKLEEILVEGKIETNSSGGCSKFLIAKSRLEKEFIYFRGYKLHYKLELDPVFHKNKESVTETISKEDLKLYPAFFSQIKKIKEDELLQKTYQYNIVRRINKPEDSVKSV